MNNEKRIRAWKCSNKFFEENAINMEFIPYRSFLSDKNVYTKIAVASLPWGSLFRITDYFVVPNEADPETTTLRIINISYVKSDNAFMAQNESGDFGIIPDDYTHSIVENIEKKEMVYGDFDLQKAGFVVGSNDSDEGKNVQDDKPDADEEGEDLTPPVHIPSDDELENHEIGKKKITREDLLNSLINDDEDEKEDYEEEDNQIAEAMVNAIKKKDEEKKEKDKEVSKELNEQINSVKQELVPVNKKKLQLDDDRDDKKYGPLNNKNNFNNKFNGQKNNQGKPERFNKGQSQNINTGKYKERKPDNDDDELTMEDLKSILG